MFTLCLTSIHAICCAKMLAILDIYYCFKMFVCSLIAVFYSLIKSRQAVPVKQCSVYVMYLNTFEV
jgi:hypothetical protein